MYRRPFCRAPFLKIKFRSLSAQIPTHLASEPAAVSLLPLQSLLRSPALPPRFSPLPPLAQARVIHLANLILATSTPSVPLMPEATHSPAVRSQFVKPAPLSWHSPGWSQLLCCSNDTPLQSCTPAF